MYFLNLGVKGLKRSRTVCRCLYFVSSQRHRISDRAIPRPRDNSPRLLSCIRHHFEALSRGGFDKKYSDADFHNQRIVPRTLERQILRHQVATASLLIGNCVQALPRPVTPRFDVALYSLPIIDNGWKPATRTCDKSWIHCHDIIMFEVLNEMHAGTSHESAPSKVLPPPPLGLSTSCQKFSRKLLK